MHTFTAHAKAKPKADMVTKLLTIEQMRLLRAYMQGDTGDADWERRGAMGTAGAAVPSRPALSPGPHSPRHAWHRFGWQLLLHKSSNDASMSFATADAFIGGFGTCYSK